MGVPISAWPGVQLCMTAFRRWRDPGSASPGPQGAKSGASSGTRSGAADVVVSARKARYLKPVLMQSPRVLRALLRRPKLQRWQ